MHPTIRFARAHRLVVSPRTTWLYLEVCCRDDSVGWGEFTIRASVESLADAVEALDASVRGSEPVRAAIDASASFLDTPVRAAVLSAFDQAVWDIEARRAGVPIATLLGGPGNAPDVPVYANINRGTADRSPEGFGQRASSAIGRGFEAIKIAPFDDLTPQIAGEAQGRALLAAALDRIQGVRDAIGSGPALMVDCHWRLTEQTALEIIPQLAAAGVSWYECPIEESGAQLPALRRIRAQTSEHGMRLAGCETLTSWSQFRTFVEGGAYDVIMPDVKYAGGYAELIAIAERSLDAGVSVSLHNPSGPVCHVASLHASVVLPEHLVLEHQFDETPMFDSSVNEPLPTLLSGRAKPPSGAGLGVTPKTEYLAPLGTADDTS